MSVLRCIFLAKGLFNTLFFVLICRCSWAISVRMRFMLYFTVSAVVVSGEVCLLCIYSNMDYALFRVS